MDYIYEYAKEENLTLAGSGTLDVEVIHMDGSKRKVLVLYIGPKMPVDGYKILPSVVYNNKDLLPYRKGNENDLSLKIDEVRFLRFRDEIHCTTPYSMILKYNIESDTIEATKFTLEDFNKYEKEEIEQRKNRMLDIFDSLNREEQLVVLTYMMGGKNRVHFE